MSQIVLVGLAAGAFYLYSQQQATQPPQRSAEVSSPEEQPGVEPVLEYDQLVSGGVEPVLDDPTCPTGYLLSTDKKSCNAIEPPPSLVSPPPPDLNLNTGSDIGDAVALTAISLGGSVAFDAAGSGVKTGVKQASAALTQSRQAALTAEKAAKVAAAKESMKAAKAAKAASVAGKATKAGSILTKLKGTPWSLIITVIAQVLIAVLDLNAGSFNPCPNGDFDLSTLPDWAQALIGALPVVGDLFELFAPVLCFHGGCPPGMEHSSGLCYPPCSQGFKSDGATVCWKQYPEFETNGMGHTITSVTKKILMDTGTIPDQPPPGTRQSGALFYADPGADYDVVAGVAWQRCPAGATDTGIRCEDLVTLPAGTLPYQ